MAFMEIRSVNTRLWDAAKKEAFDLIMESEFREVAQRYLIEALAARDALMDEGPAGRR